MKLFSRKEKAMESAISAFPLYTIMGLSFSAILASLVLQLTGKKNASLFVGQWPSTLLTIGLLKKMFAKRR